MKKLTIMLIIAVCMLSGCKMGPKEPYIGLVNVSDQKVMYSIVSGTEDPSEFVELPGIKAKIIPTRGETDFTLYCHLIGGTEMYQEQISIGSIRNLVSIDVKDGAIIFEQRKY